MSKLALHAIVPCVAIVAAFVVTFNRPYLPYWEGLRVNGQEVERYTSLLEMVGAADAVVVGEAVGVEESRFVQGDAPEDVVTYGRIKLKVTRVLAGSVPDVVLLEFLIAAAPDDAVARMTEVSRRAPPGPALFFLRHKGGSEAGLYRVTNSTGLWSATSRTAVDTPLRELAPQDAGLYFGEIAHIDSLDSLVQLVDAYARAK